MQYNVPQFVEVEDKIIGPLGLKQFLLLLFGGLICALYWSIFGAGLIFFVLAIPTMGFFAFLAFGKFNGRPFLANIPGMIGFFLIPKVRVFQRTGEKPLLLAKKKAVPLQIGNRPAPEEVQSRLQRLAYLLDQKSAEEDRLIQSGQMKEKWLNQI